MKLDLDELSARSKDDRAIIVGSEIRALIERLRAAEAVCELELEWQKYELGEEAPPSIKGVLREWRKIKDGE